MLYHFEIPCQFALATNCKTLGLPAVFELLVNSRLYGGVLMGVVNYTCVDGRQIRLLVLQHIGGEQAPVMQ